MNTKKKLMKCLREDCKNNAIIDPTFGVLPCQKCQDEDALTPAAKAPAFYSITKLHRIQQQQDQHDAEIMQPWMPGKDQKPNPDFVKTYPERAKDYFSDEELKGL